jgi:hypothetical protein
MVYLHTKNPKLSNFGGPLNGKCCFMAIRNILLPFDIYFLAYGIFFPVWVCGTKKKSGDSLAQVGPGSGYLLCTTYFSMKSMKK